ncbi:MAG: hypothetical protein OEQ39_25900, partial [Gammaproteobacteria bacterium]|nr:hypothetical protein [Gammaproteobacteria bacterium]
ASSTGRIYGRNLIPCHYQHVNLPNGRRPYTVRTNAKTGEQIAPRQSNLSAFATLVPAYDIDTLAQNLISRSALRGEA